MKTFKLLLICLLCISAIVSLNFANAQQAFSVRFGERPPIDLEKISPDAYEPGMFKIKLKPGLEKSIQSVKIEAGNDGYVVTGSTSLDALNEAFGVSRYKPLFTGLYETNSTSSHYLERHEAWGFHLWFELTVDENTDIIKAVKQFAALDNVELAEPEYRKRLVRDNSELNSLKQEKHPEPSSGSRWTPNDPQYSNQWHYKNTGQQGGTQGADISLEAAWEIEKGNANVIVAIIDDGIQFNHPDLTGNMWAGTGYNFVTGSSTIQPGDHGTHVAGTVAAVNNNGVGVAGVAGGSGNNDGVRLMSCQVFTVNSNGGFHLAPIYAADNGAAISQNSWGYTNPGVYDQAVLNAIDYFNVNGGGGAMNGGITIFAAGNSQSAGQWYPGYYSGCFSVAGTNNQDKRAWYSNYDSWIDISAPGGETNTVTARGVLSTITGNSYAYYQGTSMACPHASGVAALMLSLGYGQLTPAQVADILRSTTDDHYNVNPDYIGQLGTGRLNAHAALLEVQAILTGVAMPQSLIATGASTGQINLSWTKNPANDNVMLVWSANDVFGTPQNGVIYSPGQTLPGGGTILYRGSNNSFSHTALNPATIYYYQAYSYNATNDYSNGRSANAATLCGVFTILPFTENFNATPALPVCWAVIDNQGNGQVWQFGTFNDGISGTTGYYAYLNSDGYGSGNTQNTDLISPTLDLSEYSGITIAFKHYFRFYENETALLAYSIDNGTTWTSIQTWASTTANPEVFSQQIPALAGQSEVRIKWNYTGSWGWYWSIDDIEITGTLAGPNAEFFADPITAMIGETIIFTDASSGGSFSSWDWNFGNGANPATASGQGPHTVTYGTVGNKTVSLVVNGIHTEIKVDYISINELASSITATYTSGDILTDRNFNTLPGQSSCAAALAVYIPADAVITGVDVSYEMTARNSGWMSDQRSQLRCVSPGGSNETTLSSGSGNSTGTFSYNRTGINIANDVSGGGEILFELHAGRTYGGSGCNTTYNQVDNNTWTVTVYFHPPFTLPPDGSGNTDCVAHATEPETPIVTDHCGETIVPVLIIIIDDPDPFTCEGTRVYTYRYTDCANNSADWNFTWYVNDSEPPLLLGSLPGGNLGNLCMNEIPDAPGVSEIAALYNDNCGNIIATLVDIEITGSDCGWSAVYTYNVEDGCGNFAPDAIVEFSGSDETPPSLIDPMADCSNLDQNELNWCLSQAEDFNPVSLESYIEELFTDNCGEVSATYQYRISGNDNSDCSWSFTFFYHVSDACSNTLSCTINYSGGDTEPPLLVDSNENCSTLNQSNLNWCLYEAQAFDASTLEGAVGLLYADNCSNFLVSFDNTATEIIGDDCSWTANYTFIIADECGNETGCAVIYFGGGIGSPLWDQQSLPQNLTVECNEIPQPVVLTASGYCGNIATVVFNETSSDGNCNHNYTLTRTWTATDECNNSIIHTQIITVQDNWAPYLVNENENCSTLNQNNLNITLQEAEGFNPATLEDLVRDLYTDNCAIDLSVVHDSTIPGNDNNDNIWLFNYLFTISDGCGNMVNCMVTYSGGLLSENLNLSDDIVIEGQNLCYGATQTISVQNMIVQPQGSLTLIAGGSIHLTPELIVQNDGHLHAYISDTYCTNPIPLVASKDEYIKPGEAPTLFNQSSILFKVYPNPSKGVFSFELVSEEVTSDYFVEIIGMMGERILQVRLADSRHIFDLTGRPKGIYIIRVLKNDMTGIDRIIIH